jgi:WD40 repeat protein
VKISNLAVLLLSVYDVLTGKVHSVLSGHRACVRDVSWHPHRQELISTSVSFTVSCTRELKFYYVNTNLILKVIFIHFYRFPYCFHTETNIYFCRYQAKQLKQSMSYISLDWEPDQQFKSQQFFALWVLYFSN